MPRVARLFDFLRARVSGFRGLRRADRAACCFKNEFWYFICIAERPPPAPVCVPGARRETRLGRREVFSGSVPAGLMNQFLEIALPKIVEAIRADRSHAYGLKEPWVLPRLSAAMRERGWCPPDTVTGAFIIEDGVITVKPFPPSLAACDGATLAPDFIPRTLGGVRYWAGAIFHDRWYGELETFERLWADRGWTARKIRALGDAVFAGILMALVDRELSGLERWLGVWWVRLYYTAVRAFGALAHTVYKVFGALALCVSLSLGGCAVPEVFEMQDATDFAPPTAVVYTNFSTGSTTPPGGVFCDGNL